MGVMAEVVVVIVVEIVGGGSDGGRGDCNDGSGGVDGKGSGDGGGAGDDGEGGGGDNVSGEGGLVVIMKMEMVLNAIFTTCSLIIVCKNCELGLAREPKVVDTYTNV